MTEKIEDYYTPELHRNLVLAMTKVMHDIFTEEKIEYWINGGLELGYVRHGGMIPWDDDADLAINYSDYMTKIPKLCPIIENTIIEYNSIEYPLNIQLDKDIIKVYIADRWAETSKRIIGTPTLDIFAWKRSGDIVELHSAKLRKMFKNCYYMKSELFPLRLYKFGSYEFWGANDLLPYLYRYYGADCMRKAKIEIREPTEHCSANKSAKMVEFILN